MINTFLPIKTSNNIYKKWYLIDAKEQKLGRLSTKISLKSPQLPTLQIVIRILSLILSKILCKTYIN